MNYVNMGLWPLVVLLSLSAAGAFVGQSIRRMAIFLGIVGAGLSLFYYQLDSSFWPLIYFLIYLIIFGAWLGLALTFPAAALRDDALDLALPPVSAFVSADNKWPWRRILKYFFMFAFLGGLAVTGIALAQTLVQLPAINFINLTQEDYFIDLAALSIFLLSNVVGLIFVFKAGVA